jgi:trans-2,3-dihydro-3-hydroxyanthranilate isomerase
VVSDWPSGGNQLAVFPDAAGIAGQTMQRPARELNFPETTFVLPPSNPLRTCRVPIFTPRQELPSAGHPTLGTAAVPARRNGAHAARQFVSEQGTGPVTVTVDGPETNLHLRPPPLRGHRRNAARGPDRQSPHAAPGTQSPRAGTPGPG